MLNFVEPQASSLLISEPFMLDNNFRRSVVLLTEHDELATIGYILNHRSNLLLRDVIDECPEADFPVFVGGPVANDTLHFIHRCFDRMNSGEEIAPGIFWGGNFETLKLLVNSQQVGVEEVKFFIGYSGWGEGQLSEELKKNSWLVSNDYRQDTIFVDDEENIWKEAIISLGPRYAHIAQFPENPMWN